MAPHRDLHKEEHKSAHKVVLSDHIHKPFGSLITQTSLRPLLEEYGSIWFIDFANKGALCFVTFKSPEAAAELIKLGTLAVAKVTLQVKSLFFQTNDQASESAICMRLQ